MLRQESGTGLQVFGLTMGSGLDCHRGADRIAIAFLSAQTDSDGVANIFHRIVQHAQLRRVPVFQDDFEPPVVVQVGENKRTAVVREVQTDCTGDFGKRAIPVIGIENVSLGTSP